MQPLMTYLGEKPIDVITLEISQVSNHLFEMYEDDRTSLNYQQGDFTIPKINSLLSSENLSVEIQKPLGKFIPPMHSYMAKIHLQKMM